MCISPLYLVEKTNHWSVKWTNVNVIQNDKHLINQLIHLLKTSIIPYYTIAFLCANVEMHYYKFSNKGPFTGLSLNYIYHNFLPQFWKFNKNGLYVTHSSLSLMGNMVHNNKAYKWRYLIGYLGCQSFIFHKINWQTLFFI